MYLVTFDIFRIKLLRIGFEANRNVKRKQSATAIAYTIHFCPQPTNSDTGEHFSIKLFNI